MKKPKAKPKASGDAVDGDLAVLKKLLALLDGAAVTTIKLSRGGTSYEVSKLGAFPLGVSHPSPAPPTAVHAALAARAGSSAPAAAPAPAAVPPPSNLLEIKSPMVGTFYRAPEPGADPYVKAGSRVSPGQTLCIIEAMKIMNEIESEVSGAVREILVEDAQPVEFGQVLFRVEPNV